MKDKLEGLAPATKVQAGTVAGGIGIVVVFAIEWISDQQVDAQAALVLVGAFSAIAAYLMPDVPPWKK